MIRVPGIWMLLGLALGRPVMAGAGLFTVRSAEVDLRAVRAFVDWNPEASTESIVLQVRFQSDTRDIGMVIPTPGAPKIEPAPADFFAWLDLYTTRAPAPRPLESPLDLRTKFKRYAKMREPPPKPTPVKHREPPTVWSRVGHFAYRSFPPTGSQEFFGWLQANKYAYQPVETMIRSYVERGWHFTVMKIEAGGLEPDENGIFHLEAEPLRLTFSCESPVYPLHITRANFYRHLDLSFHVSAPDPMELAGAAMRLEWARRLDAEDQKLLQDPANHFAGYGALRSPPGVREVGIADVKAAFWASHARKVGKELPAAEVRKTMLDSLDQELARTRERIVQLPGAEDINQTFLALPGREAPAEKVAALTNLRSILRPGVFLARFERRFLPDEVVKDPELAPVADGAVGEQIRDPMPASP